MNEKFVALFLALLSFPIIFIGETIGLSAMFVVMAVYFFVCQFLLSRRHPDAWRRDWLTMLILDAVILGTVVLMVVAEKRQTVFAQAPGMLLSCLGGTIAGALVATWTARRAAGRRSRPS